VYLLVSLSALSPSLAFYSFMRRALHLGIPMPIDKEAGDGWSDEDDGEQEEEEKEGGGRT
jgi:hypothetical protein